MHAPPQGPKAPNAPNAPFVCELNISHVSPRQLWRSSFTGPKHRSTTTVMRLLAARDVVRHMRIDECDGDHQQTVKPLRITFLLLYVTKVLG